MFCGDSRSPPQPEVVKSGYFQLRQKPGVQLGQVLGCWVAAGSSNALNSRYQLSLHSNEERLLRPKGLVQLADIRTGQDTRTLNSQSCSFKDLAGRGSLLEARVGKIGLGEAGEDSTKSLPAPMPVAGCTSELLQSKRLRDRLNCRSSQAVFLFDFSLILRDEESTQNFEGAGGDPAECSETIHIFSVASGRAIVKTEAGLQKQHECRNSTNVSNLSAWKSMMKVAQSQNVPSDTLQVFAMSACCAGPRCHSYTDRFTREHDCFGGSEASRNLTIFSSQANHDALRPQAHQVCLGLWQRCSSKSKACVQLFAWR